MYRFVVTGYYGDSPQDDGYGVYYNTDTILDERVDENNHDFLMRWCRMMALKQQEMAERDCENGLQRESVYATAYAETLRALSWHIPEQDDYSVVYANQMVSDTTYTMDFRIFYEGY